MENIRDFADGILQAIGQPLLTDEEAAKLPAEFNEVDIYKFIADVLNARGFPDNSIEKLNAYAVLHDVDYTGKRTVHNNIFMGAALEN